MPKTVLQKAQAELCNLEGTGMSVLEVSHRSSLFSNIITQTEARLRKLLALNDEYAVLFMQGGATTQFAAIPLNLMKSDQPAGYIDTGVWSDKAIREAEKYGKVKILASSKDCQYNRIPEIDLSQMKNLSYIHITFNNTIQGTKFSYIPRTKVPLIADMSSCILSEPIDMTAFDVVYASAQKNIGPAGITIVIIKKALIGQQRNDTPSMLSYQHILDKKSLLNTPCTFAIYITNLVLHWLLERGGVSECRKQNYQKAQLLYNFLDSSQLFRAKVTDTKFRSIMNIPFFLQNATQERHFIKEAEKNGFMQLTGHRTLGGVRASMYNAMTVDEVSSFVRFLEEYEEQYKRAA